MTVRCGDWNIKQTTEPKFLGLFLGPSSGGTLLRRDPPPGPTLGPPLGPPSGTPLLGSSTLFGIPSLALVLTN